MPSETELKYTPPEGFSAEELFALAEIAPFCGEVSEIIMRTEYLDTPYSDAKMRGITLRRRFENGRGVLYAKAPVCTSGELSVRGEWSVQSDDLANAAALLAEAGAPTKELCGKELEVCGRVSFKRRESLLTLPEFSAMLSFDEGVFGDDVAFSEIELELVSGETDELLRFGRDLSAKYGFKASLHSKCARAIRYTTK